MTGMAKRHKEIDPMAEIEKVSALYEEYLQISGVGDIATVRKTPVFSAPIPAPVTITFC